MRLRKLDYAHVELFLVAIVYETVWICLDKKIARYY